MAISLPKNVSDDLAASVKLVLDNLSCVSFFKLQMITKWTD